MNEPWPPDPLLDEVDEARRRIMAEHGNDYRRVLAYYVDADKDVAEEAAADEAKPDKSAA
jgi:hypothetical protein